MFSLLSRLFVSALGAALVVLVMAMPAGQPAEAQQTGLAPGVFILPAEVVPGDTFKMDVYIQAQQQGVSTFDIRAEYLESFLDRSATQCDGSPSGSTCTVSPTGVRFQRQQGAALVGDATVGNVTLKVAQGMGMGFGFLRIEIVSMTNAAGTELVGTQLLGRVDGIIQVNDPNQALEIEGGLFTFPAAVEPGASFQVEMFGAPSPPTPTSGDFIENYDIRNHYPQSLLSATGCDRQVNNDILTDASYSCDTTTPGEIRFERLQNPALPSEMDQCVFDVSGLPLFNNTDDDADGSVNDGCQAFGVPETGVQCSNNTDDDADLVVNDGCPAVGPPERNQCINGVDDDADDFQDDGCYLAGGFHVGIMSFQALAGGGDAFLTIEIRSMTDYFSGNPTDRTRLAQVDGFISVFAPKTGETEVQVGNTKEDSIPDNTIEGLGDERNLGFQVGDKILIGNEGASNREERTIVGFGNSFILDSPLAHDHNPTEMIVKLGGPSPTATATLGPQSPTPTPAGAAATPARTPGTVPSAGGRPGDETDHTWLALPAAAFGLVLAAGGWRAWSRHRSGRRAL